MSVPRRRALSLSGNSVLPLRAAARYLHQALSRLKGPRTVKMPAFCYHRPATVEEAVGLLAEYGADAKVLAGGQSLVPLLALRLSHPEHLVDIGRVAGLDVVDDGPGGFTVGAGVRHSAVEASPV